MLKENQIPSVVHVANGLGGGTGSVIETLSEYQLRAGLDVCCYFPQGTEFGRKPRNVPWLTSSQRHIPGGYMLAGVPLSRSIKQRLRSHFPALFHYHGIAALGCFGSSSFPSVCTIHGVSKIASLSPLRKRLIRSAFKRNVVFTAVDNSTSDYFLHEYGIAPIVIPNGLPDSLPQASPEVGPIRNGRKHVLFLGDFSELKGYHYVLKAAELLKDRKDFDFLFAGSADENELAYFHGFVQKFSLDDSVFFLGMVDNAGTALVPYVDAIVLPSRTEGLPMVLLESLRAGIPILATNVGGIPSILCDGQNGFFVQRSGEDIANKILALFSDGKRYQNFCRASRKLYVDTYQLANISNAYMKVYRHAIESFYSEMERF